MQPNIQVGIMFAPEIVFRLNGAYQVQNTEIVLEGEAALIKTGDSQYILKQNNHEQSVLLPWVVNPLELESSGFDLLNVTIGINFHWERQEDQRFKGSLKIIEENGHLTAINILPLEEYLHSVISSEMSATSSEELLKAHAVISRSWLLAQKNKEQIVKDKGDYSAFTQTQTEHIRWYDREDHQNFDVCADDHCQRYQGITKATSEVVSKAIKDTMGQVLVYAGHICDARYSKCCGGISELFENAWEPVSHPYLTKVIDNTNDPDGYDTMLDTEEKAERWITGLPEAFCNTQDKNILSQVLNDYDQETHDFYRWRKEYTQDELKELLKTRIGIDVGDIMELKAIERGVSGRLIRLAVVGTEKTMVIGKELEIRKAFSRSHLYSSAFVVQSLQRVDGIPRQFIFSGAGWGHGVGLCQIGAAVMGARGYSYKEILEHYFKGAQLQKWY